jgi:hypothetical protein
VCNLLGAKSCVTLLSLKARAANGGKVDRREVETEEEIRDAALLAIANTPYLAGSDTIRVIDTEASRDDVVNLHVTALA